MSKVAEIAKRVGEFASNNSPAILTGLAVTGAVTTAVLAGKASFHAAEIIRDVEEEKGAIESVKEKIQLVWPQYIPAVAVGGVTVACIFGANTINSRRTAALTTAYSLTERAFDEYKVKVVETIGANKEQKVRDEIAQDRVRQDTEGSKQVIIAGSGDVLCYETLTGRYFTSNMESIRKAQNDINAQIVAGDGYASANDFWREIGLPSTGYGEQIGWNLDRSLELQFTTVLSEDNKPCLSIGYTHTPTVNYNKFS